MFGGLHIEMAALKSIGTLLQDSGWTTALVDSGIAASGTADSYLSASSVTRTRPFHKENRHCFQCSAVYFFSDITSVELEDATRLVALSSLLLLNMSLQLW